MFDREMKYNLKSFLIWMAILLGLFLVIFLVYPSIASSDSIKQIDEMMKIFPKELLEALNMDIASMTTVYGWLKSEGFVFVLLIITCYSAIMGSNIALKEESDKTIEYLNSLPISRNKVIISKYFAGLIYIFLMVVILAIFNYFGLLFSGDFNKKEYLFLSVSPLFPSIVIYSMCICISNFMHKTKKVIAISIGIVFISYLLNVLSSISNSVEFLKYFSPFTLADVRNIILNCELNPIIIVMSFIISIIMFILSIIHFNKKELI